MGNKGARSPHVIAHHLGHTSTRQLISHPILSPSPSVPIGDYLEDENLSNNATMSRTNATETHKTMFTSMLEELKRERHKVILKDKKRKANDEEIQLSQLAPASRAKKIAIAPKTVGEAVLSSTRDRSKQRGKRVLE
jgi:hypothetical protein